MKWMRRLLVTSIIVPVAVIGLDAWQIGNAVRREDAPTSTFSEQATKVVRTDQSIIALLEEMLAYDGVIVLVGSGFMVLTCVVALRSYARENVAREQLQMEMEKRQHMEARMQRSRRLEALGQLTAGVAHDFNNLLTVVMGNAEQIAARTSEQTVIAKANTILTVTTRGARLVAQMLTFSRRQMLQAELYDIAAGIQNFLPLIASSLKPTIKLDASGLDQSRICYLDRSEFELAVLNIASNADYAMPHGGCFTIRIEMIYKDQDYGPARQFARIMFEDTGDGMPEEVLERVFEPFFTTHNVTAATGLGLSQVYGFVKQTGGDITITSKPGYGTRVVIYLPMDKTNAENESKWHILVVDDQRDILDIVGPGLESHGYTASCTDNPLEALDLVDQHPIAVLVTDVVMPQMSGNELANQVVTKHPQIKVLLMTGFANVADYPVLRKPFRMRDMLARIQALLDDGGWVR